MDYATFKECRKIIDTEVKEASSKLNAICNSEPKGMFGLTSDKIKASQEYKQAQANYDTAFQKLRNFNEKYIKVFKKELAADRKLRHQMCFDYQIQSRQPD